MPPPTPSASGALLARLAPAVFLVFWASGFGVAKIGLRHAEPLTLLTLRFAIVVAILLPPFLLFRACRAVTGRDVLHLAVIGFLIQTVYMGFTYLGLSVGVSSGVAALLASTQPLMVAAAAPFITGERIGPLRWLGFLLGAAGAVTVVLASTEINGRLDLGLVLCLISAAGMAGATLYQRRFRIDAHPVAANLVQYVVGVATLAPFALAMETNTIAWSRGFGVALAWLVLANSIVAVTLFMLMARRNEAARVSSLFFLIPPVAAVIGFVLLGETLTPLALAGMAVAALGVAIVTRPT